MRALLTDREKLAALAGVKERDVQPFVAGAEAQQVTLSGPYPLPVEEPLASFRVPKDRCAVIVLLCFRSRPVATADGATNYPETFADFRGRVDGIGWEGGGLVRVYTANDQLIKPVPSIRLDGAPLFLVAQPDALVSVAFQGYGPDAAELQPAWLVDTRVLGYLLPEAAAEMLNKSNTIFL